MARNDEHSIENEPHLRHGLVREEPVEAPLRQLGVEEMAESSVWDEPNINESAPVDAVTYRAMLKARIEAGSVLGSWGTTLLIALVSGPLAIMGTFAQGNSSLAQMSGVLTAVLFAPLIEEVMKNAGALCVVETHPHWFRSRLQIAICVLASGASFAVVENLLYLNVYVQDPSPELVRWRWTVCVALHMGCAMVAGLGTMKVWSTTVRDGTQPRLTLGAPMMIAAILIHGSYNAFATILEVVAHPF